MHKVKNIQSIERFNGIFQVANNETNKYSKVKQLSVFITINTTNFERILEEIERES